jgi:hypothetical protein
VSRAVVLHDFTVVDGEVRDTLLEIIDGVAARVHHLLHEVVSFAHGCARCVDEVLLRAAPGGGEISAFTRG